MDMTPSTIQQKPATITTIVVSVAVEKAWVAQDYDAAQDNEQVGDDARHAPAGGQQRLKNGSEQPDGSGDHKVKTQRQSSKDEGLGGAKSSAIPAMSAMTPVMA